MDGEFKKEGETISAADLAAAMKANKDIKVVKCIINGDVFLNSATIEGRVTIQDTIFKDKVDWSYSTFKRVVCLERDIFEKEVTFILASFGQDLLLERARFESEAGFERISTGSQAIFTEARFKQKASFYGAQIKGDAFFAPASFQGDADFGGVCIGGQAMFTDAIFKREAIFNGAQLEAAAFFNYSSFQGDADFIGIRIRNRAIFTEARFKQKASFYGAQLEGDTFFGSTTFEGEADFRIHIGGQAIFRDATFEGEADFRIHIGGQAAFQGASFKQNASFNCAQLEADAFFNSAGFEGKVDFTHVCIGGQAAFQGASFKDEFSLSAGTVTGDLLLWGVSFTRTVNLANASCRTIFLSPEEDEALRISFEQDAVVNLRGCTYDRLHPISSWPTLMRLQQPYSSDPFNHLEQSLRRAGNDGEAADVYYLRRLRELHQKKKWGPAWMTDMLLRYLTGFGVRVRWLLYYIIPILVAGTIIFSLDGALEPKQPTSPTAAAISVSEEETSPARYFNAALMSLDLFLPVVVIPTVGEWQVSSGTTWGVPWLTLWATFMIVTGWILVPIGIAGLTGLLKR